MNNVVNISDAIEIYAHDYNTTMSYACAVFKSPKITHVDMWELPIGIDEAQPAKFATLVSRESTDLLSRFTIAITDVVQFPPSTAYLHGLGVISAALNKGFRIQYHHGTIPLNLYVITAQRPSTGKSGINQFFFTAVQKAYAKESERTAPLRNKLERELATNEKDMAKETEQGNIDNYLQKIVDCKTALAKVPLWRCNLSDATVEAAEGIAGAQGGLFNVISAEANAISVITGGVYTDAKAKKNLGLLLSAWDGEHVSTARIGREGIDCHVRASIAVLSQSDAVDTILAAGATGTGITERFLLLSEPTMLGTRGDPVYDKVAFPKILAEYDALINNIIAEEDIVIDFSRDAEKFLRMKKRDIEPKMADDGEYSNDLVGGFMGKADKHIRKIAAVLHCIENWREGGARSKEVQIQMVMRATAQFMELAERFLHAVDSHGYSGETSEVEKLISYFTEKAEKGKLKITIPILVSNLSGSKPFKGTPKLTSRIKNKILPILVERNYVVIADNTVYINPRLK